VAEPANDSGARAPPRVTRRRVDDKLVIGRLTEHGRAKYQFRPHENDSYYVRVLSSRGLKTLWGKDLERALTAGETKPKVGELVGVRRASRETVTVTSQQRAPDGTVLARESQIAHRTRWVVEKVQFFAERARLARKVRDSHTDVRESVRQNPELKSTFLSARAAEEFAAKRIADPKDRERFLTMIREAMATSIQKGEPLPDVRLKDPVRQADRAPVTPRPPRREDPTR
jgi:hypothetical protein